MRKKNGTIILIVIFSEFGKGDDA